ncbi:putative proline--tRNA ligase, mitochondrial [Cryptotermes secundus]|uniref:Probable proline--tRNA ligase, mitochondrial n=2 Tax=Cryptotermes secundus TaxID=105785 RepID=A0A2J7Q5P1_9NEOP|nr:putative proline--tRNA ligase, mitochondrial [Cryptotermes secundus]PNF23895.1 putative proline--tRNA ligase, mitochondrial [Cryptotermes secundus]
MLPAQERSVMLMKKIAKGTHRNVNYVSRLFQPQNVVPKDGIVKREDSLSKSQKLMHDLGVIRQASPGAFHLLPLGERSLQKLIRIVDDEMCKINAQKLLLPLLTSGELWKSTGRWEDIGEELFTLKDRHDRELVLSPTHEEAVTELMASIPQLSYRQLPLLLYQVTSKFRDEMRPRFGLLRGREFIMKDLYTFDTSAEAASETYKAVSKAYDNIFRRIGIQYFKVSAVTGVMGGSVSHEYHFPAAVGEAKLLICESCGYGTSLESCVPSECPECGHGFLKCCPGIEVGHTFLLGTKYSVPLKARFTTVEGKSDFLQMGSYGLGMTRILAAGVEVLSLPDEMRWPIALAPFTVCIVPPKEGSKESAVAHLAEELYHRMNSIDSFRNDLIIDNRCNMTIGKRLFEAQRTGYPFIVVIGRKALQPVPEFEVHHILMDKKASFNETALIEYLKEQLNK